MKRLLLAFGLLLALPAALRWLQPLPGTESLWLALPDALVLFLLLGSRRTDPWFPGIFIIVTLITGWVLWNPAQSALIGALIWILLARIFLGSARPQTGEVLITRIARTIRGSKNPLSPKALAYTRILNLCWGLFFLLLACIQGSLLILQGDATAWNFAHHLAPLGIGLFFGVEAIFRRFWLRHEAHTPFKVILVHFAQHDWRA
jgi:uncharacterized membrane protein